MFEWTAGNVALLILAGTGAVAILAVAGAFVAKLLRSPGKAVEQVESEGLPDPEVVKGKIAELEKRRDEASLREKRCLADLRVLAENLKRAQEKLARSSQEGADRYARVELQEGVRRLEGDCRSQERQVNSNNDLIRRIDESLRLFREFIAAREAALRVPEADRSEVQRALYKLLRQADEMFERSAAEAAVLDEAYASQAARYEVPGAVSAKERDAAEGLGLESGKEAEGGPAKEPE